MTTNAIPKLDPNFETKSKIFWSLWQFANCGQLWPEKSAVLNIHSITIIESAFLLKQKWN